MSRRVRILEPLPPATQPDAEVGIVHDIAIPDLKGAVCAPEDVYQRGIFLVLPADVPRAFHLRDAGAGDEVASPDRGVLVHGLVHSSPLCECGRDRTRLAAAGEGFGLRCHVLRQLGPVVPDEARQPAPHLRGRLPLPMPVRGHRCVGLAHGLGNVLQGDGKPISDGAEGRNIVVQNSLTSQGEGVILHLSKILGRTPIFKPHVSPPTEDQ